MGKYLNLTVRIDGETKELLNEIQWAREKFLDEKLGYKMKVSQAQVITEALNHYRQLLEDEADHDFD